MKRDSEINILAISGIYCIENKINGKKYIGQSTNCRKRILVHRRNLRNGKDDCPVLQRAWDKYGEENFIFYLLIECDESELDELEIDFIDKMNSHFSKNGYNVLFGGYTGTKGLIVSDESRLKMSVAHKGKQLGKDNPMFGKHFSEESKIKMKEKVRREKHHNFGKKSPNASSKYFGVMYDKKWNSWKARFTLDGKKVSLGQFKIEEDAARRYDKYIVENGLKNPLNFPNEYK